MSRSIDIDPATLARYREAAGAQGLDEDTIARRAGLSRRVVREVFAGRRTRIAERSARRLERVLLGTGAPGVPAVPTGTTRRERRRGLAVTILAIVIAAGFAAVRLINRPPDPVLIYRCEGRELGVRDARSGKVLWDSTFTSRSMFAAIAPWKESAMVIHGTRNDGRGGGRLFGRDLATGSPLWDTEIPHEAAQALFPREIADTGHFFPDNTTGDPMDCESLCAADFDGDGVDDIVIEWMYEPWYPACITWYGIEPDDPHRLIEKGRYFTCGSVLEVGTHDVDGDGIPGAYVESTNNATGYQGAMLTFLDSGHWSGGSIDSVSARTHWRATPALEDGSLARIVFPAFDADIMRALALDRLDLLSTRIDGDTITVEIGLSLGPMAIVRLNACLDVIDVHAAPDADELLASAPDAVRRRFNDTYLSAWVRRRARFGSCLR